MRRGRYTRGLQGPEHAGIVQISIAIGDVRRALLLDQSATAGEQLQDAGDDFVRHCLDEDRFAFSDAPVEAVQQPAVRWMFRLTAEPKCCIGVTAPLSAWSAFSPASAL